MTATGKKWKISRKDTERTHENYKKSRKCDGKIFWILSRKLDGMIFWIFEQHAPAIAMPPNTSALQFPISNHASGTHSSPLLGDRHAPGGLLRLQHLRDNRCKQTTRREMPTLAFSQAPLTCSSALRLRTTATRASARTATFRNSAHTKCRSNTSFW